MEKEKISTMFPRLCKFHMYEKVCIIGIGKEPDTFFIQDILGVCYKIEVIKTLVK